MDEWTAIGRVVILVLGCWALLTLSDVVPEVVRLAIRTWRGDE